MEKTASVANRSLFRNSRLALLAGVLVFVSSTSPVTEARSGTSLMCNPSQVKMTCLMGCYGCFEAYGAERYDMTSCCRACRATGADMVDDGPTYCIHFRQSWLKRIG